MTCMEFSVENEIVSTLIYLRVCYVSRQPQSQHRNQIQLQGDLTAGSRPSNQAL